MKAFFSEDKVFLSHFLHSEETNQGRFDTFVLIQKYPKNQVFFISLSKESEVLSYFDARKYPKKIKGFIIVF